MERLINKYAEKMMKHQLVENLPLIGGIDDQLIWNRADNAQLVLEPVLTGLDCLSILYARPAEPYWSILQYMAENADGCIRPDDSETRTFLHDIPVIDSFTDQAILGILKRRKSVVVIDRGIVTYGSVSPEQAFIVFSSVCFSLFVAFFVEYYKAIKSGAVSDDQRKIAETALEWYRDSLSRIPDEMELGQGPFGNREEVLAAMIETGRQTVNYHMVDSFFGNISCKFGDTIFISETGSSLDELSGCIDACPIDGSSCTGITASSEYCAHADILANGDVSTVLHGHPRFCVIMSLLCDKVDCSLEGKCHIACPESRFVGDIPIVPGEVGTGRYGLCHTLPPAVKKSRAAIVYGHGLFTTGANDFTDAFASLVNVERLCFEEFCGKVNCRP